MLNYSKSLRRILISSIPLAVAIYSILYWSSDHQHLADWYKSLNPYFYRAANWDTLFFSSLVNSQGNWWCLAAIIAAFGWAFILWKSPRFVLPKFQLNKNSALIYAAIILAGIFLSLISNMHSLQSTDEVFSAINFASIPAFQGFSYYALPNNHLLFNLINGMVFFWSDNLVQSGRIISMACYVVILCLSFNFLKKWIKSNWIIFGSLAILALQFPAWGFSGQARGYEMVLLFSLLSLITFWNYWLEKKQFLLSIHAFSNVAAMLTIPSYLYWWAGLLLAAFIFMLWERHIDRNYIRASIASIFIAVVLFLPALTFSGIHAFTGNRYVRPEDISTWVFVKKLITQGYFTGLLNEWFSLGSFTVLCFSCLFLPLLLFVFPGNDNRYRKLGILYYAIMIAFLFLTVFMRKLPFYRNMIAHGFIALMIILIALCPLMSRRYLRIGFGFILIIFAAFSAFRNYKLIPESLYYSEIRSNFNKLSECKTEFKPGNTVYLDDECFYWWYILKTKYPNNKLQIKYNRPSFEFQDYCIMPIGSSAPADTAIYRKVESISDYSIFEKFK